MTSGSLGASLLLAVLRDTPARSHDTCSICRIHCLLLLHLLQVLPADLRTFDIISWASRPSDECSESAVPTGGQLSIYRNKPRVNRHWRRNPCWSGSPFRMFEEHAKAYCDEAYPVTACKWIYARAHVHVHVHVHVDVHVHVHVHFTCTCKCKCTCTCTCQCTWPCRCACSYPCTYTYACT